MTVVHVTAELAPMPGGVADYVAILGAELARHGLAQRYLVTGTAGGGRPPPEAFAGRGDVVPLRSPSATQLMSALTELGPSTVLLHYSGYGFARRGAPVWLVRGLSAWKRRSPGARLVVMFHETWASSSVPWRSSFWLSAVQRACVRELARLADAVVTNTSFHAHRLRPFLRPAAPLHVQPIFSNVGEPEEVPPFHEREPVCVVFGRGGHRWRIWQRFRPFFGALLRLGIERLVEIGTEPEATAKLSWPVPAERLGPLPAHEVSSQLLRSRFGLVQNHVSSLHKSGVFMAFAAHGLVPVSIVESGDVGLINMREDKLICIDRVENTDLDRVSTLLFEWYEDHKVSCQAERLWMPLLGYMAHRMGALT